LIGNDVVDFGDPACLRAYLRPRFVERVCSLDERAALTKSSRPEWFICALFAAKEAAYKAVVKLDRGIAFAHARFVVSPRFDHVMYDRFRARLRILTGDDWVHAIAWVGGPSPLHGLDCIQGAVDPGSAVRTLVGQYLARRTGRPSSHFRVIREARPGGWDGLSPPKLEVAGVGEPLDVSLSSDGRVIAFAAPRCAALAPRWPQGARAPL
jgi:phosphopantetheinyl transferase (holo-ACP synthase)